MTDETRPAILDPTALIALLRAGDARSMRESYRRVFSGELGRAVLADMLAKAGVGQMRGPEMPSAERCYHDGRHDQAVMTMNTAGYDQISAVLTVLTDELKGQEDGGSSRGDDHRNDDDILT